MAALPETPIKAVIFDFDGVILDSAGVKTQAFAHCYAGEDAGKIAAVVDYQQRHGGIGRRDKFAIFERSLFGRPADAASLDKLCGRFAAFIETAMREVPFIPGAREALRALHGGHALHLVSGMPEDELIAVVAQRDLTPFFASVAGAPKHKREEFRRILDVEGLAPEEALAVGDSTTEFEAARDLGIPFIAIVAEGAPDFFPPDVPRLADLSGFPALLAR
ncbi:HAD family hydrolase [Ancylobacter sp.]|uniref:HAD family hydrolase n=1 Tax=Ancylobacter sp. TaxID=1872567 RepID=UPI003D152C5E